MASVLSAPGPGPAKVQGKDVKIKAGRLHALFKPAVSLT